MSITATNIADALGLAGVILLLLGYFLLQAGKLNSEGIAFSVYNLIGSALVLFSLMFSWNLPAAIMEIAWILASIYGIARTLIKRKHHAKHHNSTTHLH